MNDRISGSLVGSTALTANARLLVPLSIITFLIFSFARAPSIFLNTRFWAEEGVLYYTHMQHLHWVDALAFTANSNFQVLINLLVSLSIAVPLSFAPAVTTWGSIILSLALPYSVARAAKDNEADPVASILVVAVLASAGMTFEIFGSATNIQWYAGATLFFAIFWKFKSARPSTPMTVFVLAYGFSGVPAAMLFPAFVVMGVARKSPTHLFIAAVLMMATALQVLTILGTPTGREFDHRFSVIVLPTVLQSILGFWVTPSITSMIGGAVLTSADKISLLLASSLILSFPVVTAKRTKATIAFALLVGLAASLTQTLGAGGNALELLRPFSGGRYFFISTSAVATSFLLLSGSNPNAARIPLVCALMVSVMGWYSSDWIGFTQGASWTKAVAQCKETPCTLPVWPGLQMTVDSP
ncbi:hypothetical protein [Endobacterium cereale]|uniref:hypothetical protein n=1 Tax=Endobacterium cereale TaxID=2663029 RepID=UPI002B49CF50|nr:hypothetical protein [Endobacterium cereale]MEB2848287.1 hypothetical protein [Endobacterium cereale]